MRRLTIYFFYDPQGIVDDFVIDCVTAMAEHSERVLVVSNGSLQPSSAARLRAADPRIEISERPNEGFDVWAYKHGIELLGWETLRSYDEVVFMNFTIAGPLYPLSEMFDEMDGRDVDFWGPNVHAGENYDPWGLMPSGRVERHIQSHFIAVRKRMLQSRELETYWAAMRPITRYEEAIAYHEAIFTMTFEQLGFTWDSYVDATDLEIITSYPLIFLPREVLVERRCPFFKRKAMFLSFSEISMEHTSASQGRITTDTMACLDELGYDAGRILPNVIRSNNQYDVRLALDAVRVIRPREDAVPASARVRVIARIDSLVTCRAFERHIEVLRGCAELAVTSDGMDATEISERLAVHGVATRLGVDFADYVREIADRTESDEYLLVLGFTENALRDSVTLYAFQEAALRAIVGSAAALDAAVAALDGDRVVGALAPAVPSMLPESPRAWWLSAADAVATIFNAAGIAVPMSKDKPAWGPPGGIFLASPRALSYGGWPLVCAALQQCDRVMAGRLFNALVPFILQSQGRVLGMALGDGFETTSFGVMQYLLADAVQRSRSLEHVASRAVLALRDAGMLPADLHLQLV